MLKAQFKIPPFAALLDPQAPNVKWKKKQGIIMTSTNQKLIAFLVLLNVLPANLGDVFRTLERKERKRTV